LLIQIALSDDTSNSIHQQSQPNHHDDAREQDGGHALEPLMPIRVLVIRILGSRGDADHGDDRAHHIPGVVDTVIEQGIGVRDKADGDLADRQGDVVEYVDPRNQECQIFCHERVLSQKKDTQRQYSLGCPFTLI
jgi:hypothetical protein